MRILKYTLLALPVLVWLFWVLAPSDRTYRMTDLPWQHEVLANGDLKVFGLTLGQSILQEARVKVAKPASVGLFQNPDNELALEAYFENVLLSGLRVGLICEVEATQAQLIEFAKRNVSRSPMPSGSLKYELTEADLNTIVDWKIRSLNYLPTINWEPELLLRRFGLPDEKITLKENIAYWLYPKQGLAITVDDEGKELMQYVRPADFGRIREEIDKQVVAEEVEEVL
ncbi:MAG: hypothetical protein Q9O24_06075 [Gammaproteobacteria bacterium]|nr:hypothetical protein [Gammaproteobacteria bacterium]